MMHGNVETIFWLMIVRLGKTHTLSRDIHTDTRCLGRRLQLVGNIGFSRRVQTFYKTLYKTSYGTYYKCFHTNKDINILMISPALS